MNEITIDELKEIKFATVIDVRTKDEYERGHVPGAKLNELADLDKWSSKLKKDKEYYIICKSGGRSAMACMQLKSKGFDKCYNVVGGMDAWIDEGYEIE
ncbi:MAG: rhodanese-like domain-containing protein [Nanoarchaeota archaeon]|nr:rhodanese-like domain-containing protein [Nanoarchaeota archaeon]